MFILSPRRVVDALLHAMRLPDAAWGMTRTLQLPGITATVGEMVDCAGAHRRPEGRRPHPLGARR